MRLLGTLAVLATAVLLVYPGFRARLEPAFASEAPRYFAATGGEPFYVMRFDRIGVSTRGEYQYRYLRNVDSTRSIVTTKTFPFEATIARDRVVLDFHVAGATCFPWHGRFRRQASLARFRVPLANGRGFALFQVARIPVNRLSEIAQVMREEATTARGHALREPTYERDAFYPNCKKTTR